MGLIAGGRVLVDKNTTSGCCVSSGGDERRASRGLQLLSAIAVYCTLFTKRGYRHGDRPRFVDFD